MSNLEKLYQDYAEFDACKNLDDCTAYMVRRSLEAIARCQKLMGETNDLQRISYLRGRVETEKAYIAGLMSVPAYAVAAE